MAKSQDGVIVESDLPFPIEGVDEQRSYSRQRPGTAADALNMRSFDQKNDRARGATRPGLAKVYLENADETDVTNFSVQDINQLSQNLPAPSVVGDFQQFTYAQPVTTPGSGFSIGDGRDGANIATLPSVKPDGYALACSCWDEDGVAYVAMGNTTTGAIIIYRVESPWTSSTVISNNQFSMATGSLRNVAGMAAIKFEDGTDGTTVTYRKYLFVAVKPPSGTAYIWRLNANTGALIDGSLPFTAHNANLQNLTFSTSSVNCLAAAGKILGVESIGNGTTNQGFRTYDAAYSTITTHPASETGTIKALLVYRSWGGTGQNNATKVVSDGSAFYCIASVTTNKLKKLSAGATLLYESTTAYQTSAAGDILSIAVDSRNSKLAVLSSVTPFIRLLRSSDAVSQATGDPGSGAQWDEVGSDGFGTFMLFRNGALSNNFMTVNASVTAVLAMGAFNLPNATHSGASVNQGSGSRVPSPVSGGVGLVSLMVKKGEVFRFDSSGPVELENGTGLHPTAPQVFSAQNGPNMFFADGTVYRYYDGDAGDAASWSGAMTAGSLPTDPNGNGSKHICTWQGRTVLVIGRNLYMSKQFDPFDFDYAPSVTTATQAFQGNIDVAGELGELITCIAPFSDDVLIVGCDHSLHQMTGNPMAGGSVDHISNTLGIAFGRPYAFDPQNAFYFFGSDLTVYKMASPGAVPVPISKQIRRRLQDIDMGRVRIVMAWDQYQDGLGLWVTPIDAGLETENYFWERRVEAWQPDYYGHPKFNPMVAYAYDGDFPQDRQLYLGGRDGFIRRLAPDLGDDDGVLIESYVIIGPIKTAGFDNIIHKTLQATLGDTSGDVRYDLYWGKHSEEALAAAVAGEPSKIGGTWKSGRNRVFPTDREGFAFYLKLSSTDYWALEKITQTYKTTGLVRRRQ